MHTQAPLHLIEKICFVNTSSFVHKKDSLRLANSSSLVDILDFLSLCSHKLTGFISNYIAYTYRISLHRSSCININFRLVLQSRFPIHVTRMHYQLIFLFLIMSSPPLSHKYITFDCTPKTETFTLFHNHILRRFYKL